MYVCILFSFFGWGGGVGYLRLELCVRVGTETTGLLCRGVGAHGAFGFLSRLGLSRFEGVQAVFRVLKALCSCAGDDGLGPGLRLGC